MECGGRSGGRARCHAFSRCSQIWVPDVTPYNNMDSIINTLEPSTARVSDSGAVFWSRPGILDIMCKFSGLVAFPYDRLRCKLELGGWSMSDGFQGLDLHGSGFEVEVAEASLGSSYQEYRIASVEVRA